MKFEDAFAKITGLFQQSCGGQTMNEWRAYREELSEGVKKFPTAIEYMNSLNMRTDLSDDYKWGMEEYGEAIDILFLLVKGDRS